MENNSEILHKINSGEPDLLAEAVKDIKENGDLAIATALLQNLQQIEDSRTMTTIINLLADIKDNHFREILIQQIQTVTDSQLKCELLRIVWESSLDYSSYLNVFLNILQQDDFTTAFEASTIIENMVHNLTHEQRHTLHQLMDSFPAEKQFLVENIHSEMGCCEEE